MKFCQWYKKIIMIMKRVYTVKRLFSFAVSVILLLSTIIPAHAVDMSIGQMGGDLT